MEDSRAAFISSILYLYAPYRAVDIWVRGALPEAFSFVLFPLILLCMDKLMVTGNKRWVIAFAASLASLTLTHNLSVFLFIPVLFVWGVYRLGNAKNLKKSLYLIGGLGLALLLSAFYLLPVLFESKFINLSSTTLGYFNFRGHYATLYQLLFSRYWGYGASVFGSEDGLSLSIGLVQWLVPSILALTILIRKRISSALPFFIFLLMGWFFLFMAHNKSTSIWVVIPFMKYIQFPWRYLGVSLFCFLVASGYLLRVVKKRIYSLLVIIFVVVLNLGYFKPDLWYSVSDKDLTSGPRWEEQMRASAGDFWPGFGHHIRQQLP